MSFYNSIKQLKTKIEQKNIILVTGNVDELFSMVNNPIENCKIKPEIEQTYSIVDFLIEEARYNQYDQIEYYSPSKGVVNYSVGTIDVNKKWENSPKDDFDDLDNDVSKIPLSQYIQKITNTINNDDQLNKASSSFFVIDASDVYFDKSGTALDITNIAELLSDFINYQKQGIQKFINNRKKIVLICRFPEVLNSIIQSNNQEFINVTIQKPDFDERVTFFKKFGNKFNVKNTINDPDHEDFKEAVIVTDGLSFREILQYAKLESIGNEESTFKQLYNMATFNKTNSDWEKFPYERMSRINEILSKRVKGQDYAIDNIKKTLKRTFTGLNGIGHSTKSKKPKGILFFVGPTGTGKTELAKSLTEFIFGDENRMIRFDMSEYNHEHSDQRLIGAPPGYVGYDAGGQLTNAIKQKPFSVLLFDEIEKAHPKIFDKFLQILEDGRLTSSQGEIIDFSETFIIFTSNIGTSTVKPHDDDQKVRQEFLKQVKDHFGNKLNRLEILNRIGEKNIIPFNFITDPEIQSDIVKSKIEKIKENLKKEKYIRLNINDNNLSSLVDLISSKINLTLGGRGIITELETVFIDPLSDFIFDNLNKFNDSKTNKKYIDIELAIENKKVKFKLN